MDALIDALAGVALLLVALVARLWPQREIRVGPVKRPANWWRE